jgi:hypothetical protein
MRTISLLLEAFSPFAYLALLLAVTLPGGEQRPTSSGARTPSSPAALFCAVCAAFFIPWSGIAVLPFRTWPFYPFVVLSLILNCREWRAHAPFLVSLACFVLAADRFVLQNGLPGGRCSIESAGIILRLESIRSAKLLSAMLCFLVSLFFSFAGTYRDNAAGRVASFAAASLLSVVFFPLDTALSLNIAPPVSIVLNFLFSFAVAIVLWRLIILAAGKKEQYCEPSYTASRIVPVIAAAAGSYLLLTIS